MKDQPFPSDDSRMMPAKPNAVSAVVITLNEALRLTEYLDSVQWMDEIIVVDSGSRDLTKELALKYTPLVFERSFDDFAAQKNFGAAQASSEWIFSIDGDEVMTNVLRLEIQQVLASHPKKDRFAVPRTNIYFGQSVANVLGTDEPVRLYRRDIARFEGIVHEKVVGGLAGRLNSPFLHHSCETYAEWVKKHRRYTRLEAAKEFRRGRRFSLLRSLLAPFRVFFLRYLVLQGWRDKWAGFAISLEMAFSATLFQLELRRLSRRLQ